MQNHENLKALFFNTTLKSDAAESHTQRLLNVSASIMEKAGVRTRHIHLRSHNVPAGVQPDMRDHGHDHDDWPGLWKLVDQSNIIIVGTPIWLGEESSHCRKLIERLYAMSGELNDKGQSIFYGKVGGCVVTGNEDGLKHVAMSVLYALNHLGITIPPQADCGWLGEAGPGPSYGDEREDSCPAGFDNNFTQQNTTIMSWNCMHLAQMLAGLGIPEKGNNRELWDEGERFGFENPRPLK